MVKEIQLVNFASDKFESLLYNFDKHIKETDRVNSARSYVGDVRRFGNWFMAKYGDFKVNSVSPLDIVEYRKFMQEHGGRRGTGAAPSSINRALISIKIFFFWLNKKKLIRDNPAEDIKSVAIASTPTPKWLNRTQQAAFYRTVRMGDSTRDEAIIGLMLHTGLRVSEVCGLKRESIFISPRSGRVVLLGKGNKYREVPLNSTIRKILSKWLTENPSNPLFPNRNKKPISTRGVFNLVRNYAYLAKLEGVTPHTLRHTFCKNATDMGVPIDQLAAMAGHSTLDITKRYTTPSLDDLQVAVERLAWE